MDDTAELPIELQKGLEKITKRNDRAIENGGYGQSDLALKVSKRYLSRTTDYIKALLAEPQPKNSHIAALLEVIRPLGPELLALIGLHSALHAVALEQASTALFGSAGRLLGAECWAHGLTKHDKKLYRSIENTVRTKHSHVKYRKQAARSIAKKHGYTVKRWTHDREVIAGNWLVNAIVTALPDVFEWEQVGKPYYLRLKPQALAQAEQAIAEMVTSNAVYQPITVRPHPWTSWKMPHVDGKLDFDVTFIRHPYGDMAAACKQAIQDGSLKPAMDGVTALQSVPYRINTRVLEIIEQCIERGIEVEGLPGPDIPEPRRVKAWNEMADLEQKQWRMEASEVKLENRKLMAERVMLREDMEVAKRLATEDRFWTPMNCDWRGRVYGTCHFNFQREDRVRAMFLFADGQPIGEEGLYWLKVHVANCGDFEKISKRPLAERVAWVDKNLAAIVGMSHDPLTNKWWTYADKPFLFVAACIELTAALRNGPQWVTHLPVSFDGSCSGLQHLAAMTRDEDTAKLVNLTPTDEPQDVYQVIADQVRESVEGAVTAIHLNKDGEQITWPNAVAKMFLKHGVTRKLVKRNVMTYSYSSKKFGMSAQQQTDLMDVLQRDVLRGKLDSHPFDGVHKGSLDVPGRGARFIASHVFDAIEKRISLPAQVMKFLQSLAKTMAHEGQPVRWKTPTGVPFINRYHELKMSTVRLWMHDRGIRSNVIVGHEQAIDKEAAANGIAPNFVHSLDAAHLILTVNAAVGEGITNLATVHDSYSCLAPQARRLNQIIREQFVSMYETHDVLAEVLEQCRRNLTQHNVKRLPNAIQYGKLNLKEIEDAQFAFA